MTTKLCIAPGSSFRQFHLTVHLAGTTIWAWPERYPLIKAEGLSVGLVTTRDRVTVRSALSDLIQLVSTAAGEESPAGGDTAGADGRAQTKRSGTRWSRRFLLSRQHSQSIVGQLVAWTSSPDLAIIASPVPCCRTLMTESRSRRQ